MDPTVIATILVGTAFCLFVVRRFDRVEQRFALLSAGLHVVTAIAHWAIIEFYYVLSDVHGYHEVGQQLARLLDLDFGRFAPQIVNLFLQRETTLPFITYGAANTNSMFAVAATFIFLQGSSLPAMYLTTAWFSWFGTVCLYRVASEELGQQHQRAALIGCLLVPSVVYWGSGFTKEAFVIGCFGILIHSTYRVLRNRRFVHVIGMMFAGTVIAMLKAYTLIAFVVAVAAFVYADRVWRRTGSFRVRPIYLVLAAAFAIGGILAMGSLFPEYAPNNIAETVAAHQESWEQTTGGSNFAFGSGEAKTAREQLQFIPLAIINVLFRPSILDARSPPTAIAAIETTALAIGVISLLGRRGRRVVREALLSSPALVFCVAFVLVFGTAVGLASANLGSLSRYRAPMMPLYGVMILVFRQRLRESAAASNAGSAGPKGHFAKSSN